MNSIDLEFHVSKISEPTAPENQRLTSRMLQATVPGNTSPLFSLAQSYVVPARIGQQSFLLLLDTGSGDTWVASSFYICGSSYSSYSQDSCELGKTFELTSCDASAKLMSDVHFGTGYADGSLASGPMMRAELSLTSNLKLSSQEVGLASIVLLRGGGDNVTSGILGLGRSSLTNKFSGTDLTGTYDYPCPLNGSTVYYDRRGTAHSCNQIEYPSVGENLNSSFTLTLARATKGAFYGGTITYGGVPKSTSPNVNVTGHYTTVPMEKLSSVISDKITHYAVSVDGVQLPLNFNASAGVIGPSYTQPTEAAARRNVLRRSNSGAHYMPKRSASMTQFRAISNSTDGSAQFIVDSGTSVNFFPKPIAKAINSLFQPPAFNTYSSTTYVNCTGLDYIPSISIKIGGVDFLINPEDMVVRDKGLQYDSQVGDYVEKDICYSAVQESFPTRDRSGAVVNILGQPFLKNAMVTFDVPNEQIGLVSRPYYSSSAS